MSLVNRRLRQWGRYAAPAPEPKPASELPAWCVEGKGNAIILRPPSRVEPPPDTSWVEFEPINEAGKPRKGRHRRQR